MSGSSSGWRVHHEHHGVNEFGLAGVFTEVANTKFDDFRIWLGSPREMSGYAPCETFWFALTEEATVRLDMAGADQRR